MRSRSPLEWGRVFQGEVGGENVNCYHASPDDMQRWFDVYSKSPTASSIIGKTESAVEFFRFESDLGRLIPKREWAEAFFSLRMGYNVPGIPMEFLYFADKMYKEHRVCSLVGPTLPIKLSDRMGRPGYFSGGYTPLDAVRTYVSPEFNVVTAEKPIVQCGQWWEAYVHSEDMVCALPAAVGSVLTDDDCASIVYERGRGLCLRGVPLWEMCDCKEVPKYVYDLR